MSEWEEAEEIR